MKTSEFKSARIKTIVLISVVCFFSCDKASLILPVNPSVDIAQRSCQVVTQDWLDDLKILSSVPLTSMAMNLEVSAIERTSDSTFVYHHFDQIVGKNIINTDAFLFLVSSGNLQGQILGYYDSVNLQFCGFPDSSLLLLGEIEFVVQSTLGILGVDSDSF